MMWRSIRYANKQGLKIKNENEIDTPNQLGKKIETRNLRLAARALNKTKIRADFHWWKDH